MRLQSVLLVASLLLLVISNCLAQRHGKAPPKNKTRKLNPPRLHRPRPRPRTGLADYDDITSCTEYDYGFNLASTVECPPLEYCGIDKTTGKIQGCVPADQCPDALGKPSETHRIIKCDPSKPSCCCRDETDEYVYEDDTPCNHILDPDKDSVWKQACSLAELKPLPVCQVNPTLRNYCEYIDSEGFLDTKDCGYNEFCGIDKTSGDFQGEKCLEASECPANAKGSKEIVCDSTAPFCCCQQLENRWNTKPCNDVLNKLNNKIWQQACSLEELKPLDFCQVDPTKVVYCKFHWNDGSVENDECEPFDLCGIDKSNGELRSCVDASNCPATAKGSEKFVCDSSTPYCCCQKVEGRSDDEHYCNDILGWEDTSKWEQACGLPELKPLPICKQKPTKPTKPTTTTTTTPPPPPTPPAPSTTPAPVKKEDMNQECLNFCQDKKPKYYPDIFRVYCGSGSTENHCPSPCPSDCDRHCWDGSHLECPALGGAAPPPPPREGEPGRGTDYIDLHGDYRDTTTSTVLGSFISLLSLLILIGCVYICCCGPKQAVAVVPYQQQQIPYQSNPFQTPASTAATSSGTSLSSSESSLSSIAVKK